jgi:hypothetical protein
LSRHESGPADDADLVALVCQAFDGEIAEVYPSGPSGFPDVIELGARRVGPFTSCRTCGEGTWARFGLDGVPLCRACAWARWRTWQRAVWQQECPQ